jgi:molybdopterin synthase catalytic subunit
MLELYQGSLKVEDILSRWYKKYRDKNYGAFISFVGIVREEDSIDGLSFDIYEPILNKWFQEWQEEAKKRGAVVLMAHATGDVYIHESSYISAVLSPKRKVALKLIDEFVEGFKANAPIWKYDLIEGKRVYAKERSLKLPNSGILSNL